MPTYWETWRDTHRQHLQEYRDAHKERKRQYDKKRYRSRRWELLLKKYNVSEDQYYALLAEQHGVCAICHTAPMIDQWLCVDHCHATGNVRGLLCGECNNGIGRLCDDPAIVENAVAYLRGT